MIKPMIVPLYTKDGERIDDAVLCGSCTTFICYPTEHNVKEEYKFCHKCGEKIDWGEVQCQQ